MTEDGAGAAPRWPLEKQVDFHLKEFEFLKSEIARLDAAKRTLQIYTVGGVAGVTAWLFANRDAIASLEARAAWWLPFFVAIMGSMISRAYVRSTKEIGAYIGKIERLSAHPELGWETSIKERRRTRGHFTTRREAIVWAIILAMSLVVGLVFGIPQNALQLIRGV